MNCKTSNMLISNCHALANDTNKQNTSCNLHAQIVSKYVQNQTDDDDDDDNRLLPLTANG